MRILALDPSSTAVGWAVLEGAKPLLVDFGRLKPRGEAMARIVALRVEVRGLAGGAKPDLVVMEWSSGKVHDAVRGRSAGSGLATMGQAQGAIWASLAEWYAVEVVNENDWTGSTSKPARSQRVAFEFAAYREWAGRWVQPPKGKPGYFENDKGHDVADAIGLGAWWLRREQYAALAAGRS